MAKNGNGRKTTAVAKSDAKDSVPAYLAGTGKEQKGFDQDDLTVPMIKLLQGLSPEVKENDSAKAGEFWDTGKDEGLGKTIELIPLAFKKRFLLMAPIEDGQGILTRSSDGKTWDSFGEWKVKVDKKTEVVWSVGANKDGKPVTVEESGLHKFGSSDPGDPDSPPAATQLYEYLVLPVGSDDPILLTFARTAIKQAKKGLNSKIASAQGRGVAMQGLVFEARVITETNSAGQEYFNWAFRQLRFATQEEYQQASSLAPQYQDYRYDEESAVSGARSADGDESVTDGDDSEF